MLSSLTFLRCAEPVLRSPAKRDEGWMPSALFELPLIFIAMRHTLCALRAFVIPLRLTPSASRNQKRSDRNHQRPLGDHALDFYNDLTTQRRKDSKMCFRVRLNDSFYSAIHNLSEPGSAPEGLMPRREGSLSRRPQSAIGWTQWRFDTPTQRRFRIVK